MHVMTAACSTGAWRAQDAATQACGSLTSSTSSQAANMAQGRQIVAAAGSAKPSTGSATGACA